MYLAHSKPSINVCSYYFYYYLYYKRIYLSFNLRQHSIVVKRMNLATEFMKFRLHLPFAPV